MRNLALETVFRDFIQGSLLMTHAPLAEGKNPQRLFLPNLEEASPRALKVTVYLSSRVYWARNSNDSMWESLK